MHWLKKNRTNEHKELHTSPTLQSFSHNPNFHQPISHNPEINTTIQNLIFHHCVQIQNLAFTPSLLQGDSNIDILEIPLEKQNQPWFKCFVKSSSQTKNFHFLSFTPLLLFILVSFNHSFFYLLFSNPQQERTITQEPT